METEWISVKDQLPELVNEEPQEVKLLTDDKEELEGYFEERTWWIKLDDPFVGHRSADTFSYEINITHWAYIEPPHP